MISNSPAERFARGPHWGAWSILWLVAGLLRINQLTTVSLWYDEAAAWKTVRLPWSQMFLSIKANVHPPGYYILLKTWIMVGGDIVLAMRLLSVGLGLVAVGLIGRLTREVYNATDSISPRPVSAAWAAWMASALMALHPLAVEQSQQVRMYSLGMVLAIGLGIGTVRMLRQPLSESAWWLVTGCGLGLVLTHYYGLFTALVAAGVAVVATRREWVAVSTSRPALKQRWGFASGATGLTILGWGAAFLAQRARVQQGYWIPPLEARDVAIALAEWVSCPAIATWGDPVCWGLAVVTGGVLAGLLGAICSRGTDRSAILALMLAFAIVPIVLSVQISLAGRNILQPRYWSFAHPFFVVATAVGVVWLLNANRPALRCLGLVPLIVVAFWAGEHHQQRQNLARQTGLTQIVRQIRHERVNGEWVLVQGPFTFPTIQHGLRDQRDVYHWNGGELAHYEGSAIISQSERRPLREATAPPAERLWVVVDNIGSGQFDTASIRPSAPWRMQRRWSFREENQIPCWLELREYVRADRRKPVSPRE